MSDQGCCGARQPDSLPTPASAEELNASPTTLDDLIRAQRSAHGSNVAVLGTEGGRRITYTALHACVFGLATKLRKAGVARDDVVIVIVSGGPRMLIAVIGTMLAATCAPMNPSYTLDELERLADDVRAVAIVTGSDGPSHARELAQRRGIPCIMVTDPMDPTYSAFQPQETANTESEKAMPSNVALLLHTAGTTARPKQVPLTHANLVAAAKNVVSSLDLRASDRCLNVMPLFHSHGLLGAALSSLAAGASIICAAAMDPRHFVHWASSLDATWYTAAPTIHQLALQSPGEWSGCRFIRSASAPLAPQIAEQLEARFGAPMIEVYGMTEAYQIAANPLPPGKRRLGTVGVATGTEIAVLADDGHIHREGMSGEVIVAGPSVFSGYLLPPEANDDAFVDEWFRTGDLGYLGSDGFLTITGRVKEQINRGGEKIAPREIDEALLAHPSVSEAMAFPIPDEVLGEDIGAVVVPVAGAEIDGLEIRRFLSERLAPFKVPRRLLVADALPKSSTGKLKRLEFARDHAASFVSPIAAGRRDEPNEAVDIDERVAIIWQQVLGLEKLPLGTDQFFDLGGSSLTALELVVEIEDQLGIDLPVIEVAEVSSLNEFTARLKSHDAGTAVAGLLRPYRVAGTGLSAVLVPGAWGMGVGLNLIGDALDEAFDVYLFDYPGHHAGTAPASSVRELSDRLLRELSVLDDGAGLVLYGNSMGSWVVLDAAMRLHDSGRPPLLVALGDMYHPQIGKLQPSLRPSLWRRLLNRARRLHRERFRRTRRSLAPGGATPSARTRRSDVFEASLAIQRKHRIDTSYAGQTVLLIAEERAERLGADLGWGPTFTGPFTVCRVDGGHSDMHRAQATQIAGFIEAAIDPTVASP